ncbi:MAG: EAL domain-containing protein [Meiothermus sp.]|uniref:EAL domain-containing protein n=1 Tax=Meiothermus sp. TaxID=1955249 RepID=UPI0025DD1B6C|nr:EAL domain-containing protein [Meiothermus sp.]MCS7068649.1 EAL domain-containing protein [Meiothermus sp.]MDW8426815.1 EAL domain-containing protein [Meiothermus sp.]
MKQDGPNFNPLEFTQGLMVACTDLEGRYTYANRAYLAYTGLKAPLLGASALEHVAKEDLPRVMDTVKQALENPGQAFWVEFGKPLRRAWNRSRWEFIAVCDEAGKPVGLQCVGYDISDAYRQGRFQEASLQLLSSGLKEELRPKEVLQRALDAALAVVPAAQAGSATLLYPDGCFHFVAVRGYDLAALEQVSLHPGEPLSLSQHIQARVFTQADLAAFNARLDPERRSLLEGPGRSKEIQAMLATPVVVRGQPRAYLYLDHFRRADAFDKLDLRHLEGLAHHVAWLLYGEELQEELRFSRYHHLQTGLANLRSLQEELLRSPLARRALVTLRCRSLERLRWLEGETAYFTAVRKIARAIQADLRLSDRLAWEEGTFWMLLEGVTEVEEVYRVLGRLQAGVKTKLAAHWPELDFNPRIGVALAQPGVSPLELPRAAELALEQSLPPGRVHFFDLDLARQTRETDALRRALAQALRRLPNPPEGFTLHYQPIFRLAERRLHHFEALLRWIHPELGQVSPGRFLPLVEEEGWMPELGEWILGEAVRQAARWGVAVAVNLAGGQLEPGLPDRVAAHLARCRLPPGRLIFEVTEGVALEETGLHVLQILAERGHPLHLDDFGSGMSSLERITQLPFAAIKLGQGFMAGLGSRPKAHSPEARLLHALQGLGEGLGLEVIVEGIESQAQLDFLIAEGFALGQGYLLGRPAAPAQAELFLEGRKGRSC